MTCASMQRTKMKCALLLDIVIRERTAVLKLFSSEDETLLVGWDPLDQM